MTIANLSLSNSDPTAFISKPGSRNINAPSIGVTEALKSGLTSHSDIVTISREGSQTTGNITRTAFAVTTENAINGRVDNVTQQQNFASTTKGSDNLISLESASGNGVNFDAITTPAKTPTETTAQSAPTPQRDITPDHINSAATTASASLNALASTQPISQPTLTTQTVTNTITNASDLHATPAITSLAVPPAPSTPENAVAAYANAAANTNAPVAHDPTPAPPPAAASPSITNTTSSGSGGYSALANLGVSTSRGNGFNVVA